ncbi:hypothetical protein KQH54_01020 [bacterium]|nr:hypothetical protein [bacterium]
MSDGRKSCLGFGFLILGLLLAGASILVGGIGQLVEALGGDALGINLRIGGYVAIGIFVVLFAAAIYFFVSIRNWAWLPAIAGGVYAILPDLIFGPEDDALAMVAGVVLSGLLSWLRSRNGGPVDPTRPEKPPKLL